MTHFFSPYLCNDCIYDIIEYSGSTQTLLNVALCSKEMKEFVFSKKYYYLETTNYKMSHMIENILCDNEKNIQDIINRGIKNIIFKENIFPINFSKNNLSLLNKFESIDFSRTNIGAYQKQMKKIKNVKKLFVKINNVILVNNFQNINLVFLKLEMCNLNFSYFSSMKKLETLILKNCTITVNSKRKFILTKTLKKLEFDSNNFVDTEMSDYYVDDILSYQISFMKELKYLDVNWHYDIQSYCLENLENLEYLNISKCINIDENTFSKMTKLKTLIISYATIESTVLTNKKIFKNLQNLRNLNIRCCYNFTSEILSPLKNLERLWIDIETVKKNYNGLKKIINAKKNIPYIYI